MEKPLGSCATSAKNEKPPCFEGGFLWLLKLIRVTGAGDGTRTRDNLLGRYIAVNGVAQIAKW